MHEHKSISDVESNHKAEKSMESKSACDNFVEPEFNNLASISSTILAAKFANSNTDAAVLIGTISRVFNGNSLRGGSLSNESGVF